MKIEHSKIIIIFLLIGLVIFPALSKSEEVNDKNYNTNLQIINGKNEQINNFKVKIVKGRAEMERGLMFVTDLAENQGMLFEFGKNEIIYMWMKNTKISLDMIFINKNNQIVNIKNRAIPESLDIISSEEKSTKVLEINGGLCQRLGINIGDKIVVVTN